MLEEFALILAGLVVIAFASTKVIQVLSSLSFIFRIPKFLMAFLILGLGTSLPDMIVSAVSASQGQMQMVLGLVIGSNIIVLTIMLGIVALIKGEFRVREKTVLENFGWIFFVLMIPLFLLMDGRLSFIDGLLLIIVYFMYAYLVYTQEMALRKGRDSGVQLELELGEAPSQPSFYRQRGVLGVEVLKLVVFLAVVVLAAEFVVQNALVFSVEAGIPPILLGFSIIALGVTLPQLALELTALKAKEEEVIWGDIIGGFITELTLVLGVAALFTGSSDAAVDFTPALAGYVFMFISFVLVFFFTYSKKRLTRIDGVALLFLYLIFMIVQFNFLSIGPLKALGG
jgi:cation:H+ antiporter